MKKSTYILAILFLISSLGYSQKETPDGIQYIIKGGAGTSWIIMPKVFLLDETNTANSWQILPATNSFTGYAGLQVVVPLGNHWLFTPEIDYNYIAGEIRVDAKLTNRFSQKLQSYGRIEVPLNFGVVSSDNFWITFGPVVFFTISDNKGFDNAVYELTNQATVNSDNPVGLRFRLATYILLGEKAYLDIKFDSDLNRDFHYSESDDIYHMTMSMQSITIGFGWKLKKKN